MDDSIDRFAAVYGLDFSGARLAGRNCWLARIEPRPAAPDSPPYRLVALANLGRLAGSDVRADVMDHLVRLIVETAEHSLWAMDFPFGLPVEVLDPIRGWARQFDFLAEWGDDAYGAGLECLRRARQLGGPGHIRRLTDAEEKAPFDAYHYRIIYQTFHGMRDVLGRLRERRGVAILPFQYRRSANASRVVIEACPSSTLKRLRLPHQNYKQTTAGRLTAKRVRTRKVILAGLERYTEIGARDRRVMMGNLGGDALDAVIAAVGAVLGWCRADHAAIARHPRYRREGKLYV